MSPFTDPRVRLLFSAPLAATAAALARTPEPSETGMASAVPRILVAAFVCVAIAYVASSADADRRGPWNFVSGLALSACAALALSFGASLCVAMALSGGFDVLAGLAFVFALLLMTSTVLILAYVIATIVGVRVKAAAAVMACQVVPLAALILEPRAAVAYAVSAAAAVTALHDFLRLRAAGKK